MVVGGQLEKGSDGFTRPLCTVGWVGDAGVDMNVIGGALADGLPLDASPLMAAYLAGASESGGRGLTRTDLLPDREWYPSHYFQALHKLIGTDHSLVSCYPVPGESRRRSGITLSRGLDVKRDFSLRHRAVVTEAQRQLAPLMGGPLARFDEPSPAALPPRVRDVLRCVLDGDSDKQVAARLGISGHTVNQYTKAIHRHFGVSSRAELLARWIRRGWGRGAW